MPCHCAEFGGDDISSVPDVKITGDSGVPLTTSCPPSSTIITVDEFWDSTFVPASTDKVTPEETMTLPSVASRMP